MSRKLEYRKASDWVIGEELREHAADASLGTIVSIRNCSSRPTMAFMVVFGHDRTFTIYSVIRDARCSPIIARKIPGDVIVAIGEDIAIFMKDHQADVEHLRKNPVPPAPDDTQEIPVVATGTPAPQAAQVVDDSEDAPPAVPARVSISMPSMERRASEQGRTGRDDFDADAWFLKPTA
jgi:hypothetical protein